MKKILLALLFVNISVNAIYAQKPIQETCLTQNETEDRFASFSPGGDKIVFESDRDGNWEIYAMNADGSDQLRLTTHSSEDRRPTWHPSGKKILFESNRSGKNELYTLDLRKTKIRKLTALETNSEPIFAQFSPNGKRIAVSLRVSESEGNIFLLNNNGRIVDQITNAPKRTFYPRWSRDGQQLVYFSRKDTDNQDDEIYTLNLENRIEKRLTQWPKNNFCPSWSNNGEHVAYVTSMEGSRPEIYVMNADGTNETRITYNEDGETLPNWSPDDTRLLITAYRGGNYEICVLDVADHKP